VSQNDEKQAAEAALKFVEQVQQVTHKRDWIEIPKSEWEETRADLDQVLDLAQKLGIVEVIRPASPDAENIVVHVKPRFYQLRDEVCETVTRRRIHREVIIDGEKIDVRSPTNYTICVALPEALEAEIRSLVFNMLQAPDRKVRYGSEMRLRKILLLRYRDIPVQLRERAEQVLLSFDRWKMPKRRGKRRASAARDASDGMLRRRERTA
jgi:hypothetical protein